MGTPAPFAIKVSKTWRDREDHLAGQQVYEAEPESETASE